MKPPPSLRKTREAREQSGKQFMQFMQGINATGTE